MKIFVQVKPNSKERTVDEIGENRYLVRLKSKPQDNMANMELVEVIAEYFNKPKWAVKIVSGKKSRSKILEVK